MKAFLFGTLIICLASELTTSYQIVFTRSKRSSSDFGCGPDPNPLKNLFLPPVVGTKEAEIFSYWEGAYKPKEEQSKKGEEPVIKYTQDAAYVVGKDKGYETRVVVKDKESSVSEVGINFVRCQNQIGYVLPFQENHHTYMFWEWGNGNNWFFTADLTGCDMFVAKNPDFPNRALIIHSNLNRLKEDEEQNLRLKAEIAQAITADYSDYRIVMRAYHQPTSQNAITYIKEYEADHSKTGSKIFVYPYDRKLNELGFIFFGKDGNFYLKSPTVGKETIELKANLE